MVKVPVPELGFNGKKLKPLLQQSIIRIGVIKAKRTATIVAQKKSVAKLLGEGQIEKARLETERIIKSDWLIEALDLCQLFCETVRDNAQAISQEKECPIDLEEAVITLIYCAYRTEVKELVAVTKQFRKKYGSEFIDIAQHNRGKIVNDRIVHKLSGQRPNAFLVVSYMKEIAKIYNVNWVPDEVDEELGQRFDTPMVTPTGAGQKQGGASGLGAGAYSVTDGRILRPGEKPKGYIPPDPKLDTILPLENDNEPLLDDDEKGKLDENNNNDDDDDDDDEGGGGNQTKQTEIPVAKPVSKKEEDTVNEHAVRGKEAEKPKKRVQYVEQAPPKKEDELDALQARFNKLKNL